MHQEGRIISIEFVESVCNKKENRRRQVKGEIYKDYTCYQIKQETSIHQDVYGNPIDITVNRRMGCELRCVAKQCGVEDLDV